MIVTPIKIQGKKTKIIPKIRRIASVLLEQHPEIDTWVEPFLGSGVVALNCPDRIKKVIVNDINPHIIKFYQGINDGTITATKVREVFEEHDRRLQSGGYDYYNEIKNRFNQTFESLDFLFLTRTGFNGVMRFNSKGLWNVPFCKLTDRLSGNVVNELTDVVQQISDLFKKKEFVFYNKSFEEVMELAPDNSIFYCDPPYYGLNVQYYKGWEEEQEILLNQKLAGKVFIYSTWIHDGHHKNPMIEKLWGNYIVDEEEHKYNVASKSTDRKGVIEGLIYNNDKSVDNDFEGEPLF